MSLFAHHSLAVLAQAIAQKTSIPYQPIFQHQFSDGNSFIQLNQLDHNFNIFLQTIAGENANHDFLELLFALDAAKRANSQHNLLVFPYFSYAKADQLDGAGTSLRAAVCAAALESAGATSAIFLDWHSDLLRNFFTIPITNVSPVSLFTTFLQTNANLPIPNSQDGPSQSICVISPDRGYARRARQYARALSCPLAIGTKKRADHHERIKSISIDGDFSGKTAIIVDDFTTSGHTLLYLADLLHQRGATKIIVCVTHCLLNSTALTKISRSPIDLFITTNSLPHQKKNPHFTVLDCSPLLATAIQSY